jgi:hypothetical protein
MVPKWIREMFWNVLEFGEIQNYLLTVILYGMDYQVYFCVAVISHINECLLSSARDEKLIYCINDAALCTGFSTAKSISFMHELCAKHRAVILHDMSRLVLN